MVNVALGEYGIHEYQGIDHNPEVLKYFEATDYNGADWITDETAWCSAFINWVAWTAGYERTKKLNARSWLDIGTAVTDPVLGDVVVLWRESRLSWKGHVGLYINSTEGLIWILGGNQSNKVCIAGYPESRLLSYRRLSKTDDIE